MNRFHTNKNHPIISREQNYLLQKKLVSFHSEDRDISQWPKANNFQINLPVSLSNVQSMKLVNISLPSNQNVFSKLNQNTKFQFTIDISGGTPAVTPTNQIRNVEISEGTYTPGELAIEIQNKMNYELLKNNNSNNWNLKKPVFFVCKYNKLTNSLWFGVNGTIDVSNNPIITEFTLDFDKKMTYDVNCTDDIWCQKTNWGLPYYLGYEKKKYTSKQTPYNPWFDISNNSLGGPFGFDYEILDPSNNNTGGYWLTSYTSPSIQSDNLFIDISSNPYTLNIKGQNWIYMEMEKYNSIDEIKPNSINTNAAFNNDYNGKVNSAFAKIQVGEKNFGLNVFSSSRNLMSNVSFFTPPLYRINRLKFKFRYHDGRLVDFKGLPISFVIEFNLLYDEPPKKMNIIVPSHYSFT